MVTVGRLAQQMMLPNMVGSHVIDKTSLVGSYDFTLYYKAPGMSDQSPGLDDAPPFAVAIQQQLGLKLVPSKALIDVLVIDSSEKTPIEN